MKIKEALLNECKKYVDNRLQTIQETISSNQKALQSETKSSAGDKHETGRAMLQLEMEKAGQQLASVNQMKTILDKINISKTSKIAHLGSVIFTVTANYYLAISAGQFVIDKNEFFAISISSPIGKLLLGKKENDEIVFNSKTIKINQIF